MLEIAVGTGKNLQFYPENINKTAIDLTPGMLKTAKQKALELGVEVNLKLGDVQKLELPSNYFDAVVAAFVFCSVPDPILGLQEAKRVLKPGGKLLLLEHVRSESPVLGKLMDIFNPFVAKLMGPNINRDTISNIKEAGFTIEYIDNIGYSDIFQFIISK